jgi:hypothetical protein
VLLRTIYKRKSKTIQLVPGLINIRKFAKCDGVLTKPRGVKKYPAAIIRQSPILGLLNYIMDNTSSLKLFMLLLGSKAPGRHTEQHDFFFGIAQSLRDLVPDIKAFWPEAGEKIHVDGWREVNTVEGYAVSVVPQSTAPYEEGNKLFFINLGGYQENRFEEQHYVILTVKPDRTAAFNEAKQTLFFQNNHFAGATSHIDDKYGIDVDDLYQIEDILSPAQKQQYRIKLTPGENLSEDKLHLGYFKLNKL